MSRRKFTVDRYKEIERLLGSGRGVREIARALKCSRRTVREIRDGQRDSPEKPRAVADPLWMAQVDWTTLIRDLGLGHPLEWIELSTGEIRKAYVFVAGLGFSQLLFAWAAEDTRSRNWLSARRRMFEFYGGVAHVTVPDCLKQGVLKCHLYDPDLNPGYAELAAHYGTAVVPARAGHAKDKAIVEGLVRILMRYARFRHRRQRFTSLTQLNIALRDCVERINSRAHSRFGIPRLERFQKLEKAALKPLPVVQFDVGEWREAKLHPDCYIQPESVYYSAPHIHRGKLLRVKVTEHHVEIFLELERLAIHPRCRHRDGRRIKIDAHFPPAS